MGKIMSAVLGALGTRNVFMEAGKATKELEKIKTKAGTRSFNVKTTSGGTTSVSAQNITPEVARALSVESRAQARVLEKKGDLIGANKLEQKADFYGQLESRMTKANSNAAVKSQEQMQQLDNFSLNSKAIKTFLAMNFTQQDDEEDDKYGK